MVRVACGAIGERCGPDMTGSGATIFHTEASMAWGGQELRVLAELDGLAKRGHRTGLICENDAPIAARARAFACPVYPVRFRWSADPMAIRRVTRVLRGERVDVLATHSSLDAWVGGIAARWCRIPVVRTRHLDLPLKRNVLSRSVYRLLADMVVVTGRSGAERLALESGVAAGRLVVVPTGIDPARFDPQTVRGDGVRRALGIADTAPVVGTIGVLRAIKGTDVFLRGCRAILDRIPSVRFLVAGDGPMRREVRELRDALGLSETVHLLGHRDDVPELLAAMDVFVFPTLGGDINAQAVSQAMAMNVPVVASDIPGNQEQARDGDTALLFPSGNAEALAEAVCRLIGDSDLRGQLAARAQVRIREGYSLEAMLDKMEGVYCGQVARRRGQEFGTGSAPRARSRP